MTIALLKLGRKEADLEGPRRVRSLTRVSNATTTKKLRKDERSGFELAERDGGGRLEEDEEGRKRRTRTHATSLPIDDDDDDDDAVRSFVGLGVVSEATHTAVPFLNGQDELPRRCVRQAWAVHSHSKTKYNEYVLLPARNAAVRPTAAPPEAKVGICRRRRRRAYFT